MVLQEALKEPLSGPGEAGAEGWGAGVRAGNPSWRGMECFKRNVFRTSRTRASATAPLVILIAGALALERGGGKGKKWSPLLSYSLSHWRTSTSQDISKEKHRPERMGSTVAQGGGPDPSYRDKPEAAGWGTRVLGVCQCELE